MANPLSGLDIRGITGGTALSTAASLQQMDANRQAMQQRETQMQNDQRMRELAPLAAQGDPDAITEFYSLNPQMAQAFEARANQMDPRVKKATTNFLAYLRDQPKERWDDLVADAVQNPMLDIDEQAAAAIAEGSEATVNLGLVGLMGAEQYKQVFGGKGGGDGTASQADFQYYQKLKERDPEAAQQYGMAKGYVETGREAMPTTAERDWETYQKLKRENPEEARQYGQAAGFVSKEGRELSVAMQKRLSQATDEAAKSSANIAKYNDLADQVEQANIEGGWAGRAGEFLKEVTGQQDFKSELRKDYFAIRGSQVVNNLPPGAASDTDIALALAGFPTENASGKQISSFLRGLSKLAKYEQRYNEFKANYISENGTERGMLSAWKDEDVQMEVPQRTIGKYKVSEVN